MLQAPPGTTVVMPVLSTAMQHLVLTLFVPSPLLLSLSIVPPAWLIRSLLLLLLGGFWLWFRLIICFWYVDCTKTIRTHTVEHIAPYYAHLASGRLAGTSGTPGTARQWLRPFRLRLWFSGFDPIFTRTRLHQPRRLLQSRLPYFGIARPWW